MNLHLVHVVFSRSSPKEWPNALSLTLPLSPSFSLILSLPLLLYLLLSTLPLFSSSFSLSLPSFTLTWLTLITLWALRIARPPHLADNVHGVACSEDTIGHLIINQHHHKDLLMLAHNASMLQMESIMESGIYYIKITNCKCSKVSHKSYVDIHGMARWVNPYGYLSSDLYPYLPFYVVMAFNYVLLGVVCVYVCMCV